jgi:hypothetical protein
MVGEMGGNAKPSSVCWIFWWEDCGSEWRFLTFESSLRSSVETLFATPLIVCWPLLFEWNDRIMDGVSCYSTHFFTK